MANKTIPELGGQFKAMSDEIKALQTLLEGYKTQRQAVTSLDRQMGEICETLGKSILAITEYDDKNVRQLIDTIKVVGDNQLLIIFKGGFELEQTM
ncbi:MAG: hypothetical protein RSF40_10030 [Oscillospiraceae bacterium]